MSAIYFDDIIACKRQNTFATNIYFWFSYHLNKSMSFKTDFDARWTLKRNADF